ncbi:hypothetical protein [uncultured Selenomonas sp.]|nr:hypothetical protein [uncultured Selenomonas sp.]
MGDRLVEHRLFLGVVLGDDLCLAIGTHHGHLVLVDLLARGVLVKP